MKMKRKTFLRDYIDFAAMGIKALENDNFTQCFEPNSPFEMDTSGIFYIFSFTIRYFILFPIRFVFLSISTILFIPVFVYHLYYDLRLEYLFRIYCRAWLMAFGAKLRNHGRKEKIQKPHIYVANHTSFVDFFILSSHKFCHACVSENHGGFFGFLFSTILKRVGSLTFKRSLKHDREVLFESLKKHIYENKNTAMLIFPEGTCVNNKYTVLFQKGAFEIDCEIYPVCIKFRRNLMDPYWNRRKHTFTEHIFYLMTRWRLEADIWYLPMEKRKENETASDFSMRIKNIISDAGGFRNSIWNGYFKSSPVIRDRELLRIAYKNAYHKKEEFYKEEKPISEHRFQNRLNFNENARYPKKRNAKNKNRNKKIESSTTEDLKKNYKNSNGHKLYFGGFTYEDFLDIVLNEYLAIKNSSTYDPIIDDVWLSSFQGLINEKIPCDCLQKRSGQSCRSDLEE